MICTPVRCRSELLSTLKSYHQRQQQAAEKQPQTQPNQGKMPTFAGLEKHAGYWTSGNPAKSSPMAEIPQDFASSPPIPKPIPVVFNQLVIWIILLHFQVRQRKLDHLFPLASFADNAKRFAVQVLRRIEYANHRHGSDDLFVKTNRLGVAGLKWEG